MKTTYAPDNTRRSVTVLLALAAVVVAIASLVGLSDKPDVSTILITPGGNAAAPPVAATFDSADTADEATSGTVESDTSPAADTDITGDASTADASAGAATEASDEERTIILVPTVEPTPTPGVAAAVEPTPVPAAPESTNDASTTLSSAGTGLALPTTAGTIQGSFFLNSDENDGAIVAQNLITISFAEDSSGAFQGVLEITYVDNTRILLNMSGPLTLAPSAPQVQTTLTGAFTLDAPIDADDVTASDAELTISSLSSGSGSLCTSKCFGFTFPGLPPQ